MEQNALIDLTAEIASNYVANNSLAADDLPSVITKIHSALASLGQVGQPAEKKSPAVSVRSSVKPDFIVCLEDGKKLKMLKRHLMTHYNMTPEEYRQRWNLPIDYPMVAPNYSEHRRALAKKSGLGAKKKEAPVAKAPAEVSGAPGTKRKNAATETEAPAKKRSSVRSKKQAVSGENGSSEAKKKAPVAKKRTPAAKKAAPSESAATETAPTKSTAPRGRRRKPQAEANV